MKTTVGYLLFALSCIAWLLVFLVPFLALGAAQKAATVTGLIVVGEGAFYLSVILLGKQFFQQIKAWFGWKSKEALTRETGKAATATPARCRVEQEESKASEP